MAAVDDSVYADAVIGQAAELVDLLSTDLIVLSVVDTDPMKTQNVAAETVQFKTLHHRLLAKYLGESKLTKESESPTDGLYRYQVKNEKVTIESKIMRGRPADTICESAEKLDAFMVVVGRAGLGSIGAIVLEGFADQIVRRCPRPVLVVKSGEILGHELDEKRNSQFIGTR